VSCDRLIGSDVCVVRCIYSVLCAGAKGGSGFGARTQTAFGSRSATQTTQVVCGAHHFAAAYAHSGAAAARPTPPPAQSHARAGAVLSPPTTAVTQQNTDHHQLVLRMRKCSRPSVCLVLAFPHSLYQYLSFPSLLCCLFVACTLRAPVLTKSF
jgi:hypothetical protein